MSEPKFTKGEWFIVGPNGTGWEIHAYVPWLNRAVVIQHVSIRPTVSIGDDGNVHVHVCYESWNQFPSPDWREMQESNANLIKASPKLYEALQAMVDEQVDYMTINNLGDPEKQHNIKLARAALAAARGENTE